MKKIISALFLTVALSSCGGGGGGGDDYVGAALVSLNASPREIDPGDRTRLTIQIAEVDENGIALKIRFPTTLAYVPSSGTLEVPGRDGDPFDVTPTVTVRADDFRYVVYYFKQSVFGEDAAGTLRLQLEALSEGQEQAIGVDADVDDPRVSNTIEFDADNPEFEAEDEQTIDITN